MSSEGYSLRTRVVGRSSNTSEIDNEPNEKRESVSDTSIKHLYIEKLVILLKKTLNDYDSLASYEKRTEIGIQIKYTLRRYLLELVRYNVIELNEHNKNLPMESVIAESNLFLLDYSIVGI